MLFFDGRYPRCAWPVLAEYIRPNEKPKKSNSSSGTLQIRVFSSLTVSFSLLMILRSCCKASFGFASPTQDHEVVGIGHDARTEALLEPEHLPSQHKPAHVEVSQQW